MAELTRSTLERLGHDSLVDVCLALMDDMTQARYEREDSRQALRRLNAAMSTITDQTPYEDPRPETTLERVAENMRRLNAVYGMTWEQMAHGIGARLGTLGVTVDLEPTGAENAQESAPGVAQAAESGDAPDPQDTGTPLRMVPKLPDVTHSAERFWDRMGTEWITLREDTDDPDASLDWYVPRNHSIRGGHRLEWVEDAWGPLSFTPPEGDR